MNRHVSEFEESVALFYYRFKALKPGDAGRSSLKVAKLIAFPMVTIFATLTDSDKSNVLCYVFCIVSGVVKYDRKRSIFIVNFCTLFSKG